MKFVVIDCNNVCHRAFHVTGKLDKGTTYGFLRELQGLRKEYRKHTFIFCWDSRHSFRKAIFKGYKEARENRYKQMTGEERAAYETMREEMKRVKTEVLWDLGYNNVRWQKGYEADDLIAEFVKRRLDKHGSDQFTIVSGDHDLYQLLEPRVVIHKGAGRVYTHKQFQKDYGIEPSRWTCVKALTGCDTDDVPGVGGVGGVTAIKYLTGKLKADSNMVKRIESSREVIDRNHKLVRLPLPGVRPWQLKEDDATHKRWNEVVRGLGMKSLAGLMS